MECWVILYLPFSKEANHDKPPEELDLNMLKSKSLSNDVIDLICNLIQKDSRIRSTAIQALEHLWITKLLKSTDTSLDVINALEGSY